MEHFVRNERPEFDAPAPAARSSSPDDPLVELRAVDVDFSYQRVLRHLTLSVPRGQSLAIIGESGCGKTVSLKTMIGLVRPTRGTVMFDRQDINGLNERELTRQRIRFGFLFQQAALFDSLTVGHNVAFPLRQHTQLAHEEIREIVIDRLAEVGLPASVANRKPAELSGGMRKRVGLARALTLDPELILYDEPTTGLDPIMSDVINELILRTHEREGVTSVVVTHDMNSARKVADRIVMLFPVTRLKTGEPQIIFDGRPDELDDCGDRRVLQFVNGEAGERLMEMRQASKLESI